MKTLGFFLTFLLSLTLKAQTLEQFQWEKRVLIISGDVKTLDSFQGQYQDTVGIQERKLAILKVVQDRLEPLKNDSQGQLPLPKFISSPYQYYLIGLDGKLKLKSKDILSQENLFKLIDSMPMRANEIRRKHE